MPNVTIIITPGPTKPLSFNVPTIPRVGDCISIARPDKTETLLTVSSVLWRLGRSKTEIVLQCDRATGENAQDLVDYFERMTGTRSKNPVSVQPKIALKAPSPHLLYCMPMGRRYQSDAQSMIREVEPEDVENLLKQGCARP